MNVGHVEAGLRSNKLFNPFPEWIDRIITGRIARMHFDPDKDAEKNLSQVKGVAVDTGANTLVDSLRISERIPAYESIDKVINRNEPYFVFVIHRQKNDANKKLSKNVSIRLRPTAGQYPTHVLPRITKERG